MTKNSANEWRLLFEQTFLEFLATKFLTGLLCICDKQEDLIRRLETLAYASKMQQNLNRHAYSEFYYLILLLSNHTCRPQRRHFADD
ncbi:hypothetical protein L596_006164 [Steinernema carpocapsae]|uniref:Uncharacterized protein n=1 Tax=Steinernema carpocapsae TaxID=34508 RepID=A0A4U8V8Q7_STECR|nr:hypothetical protein L596_006164 [Steinernema carpocapsae]